MAHLTKCDTRMVQPTTPDTRFICIARWKIDFSAVLCIQNVRRTAFRHGIFSSLSLLACNRTTHHIAHQSIQSNSMLYILSHCQKASPMFSNSLALVIAIHVAFVSVEDDARSFHFLCLKFPN